MRANGSLCGSAFDCACDTCPDPKWNRQNYAELRFGVSIFQLVRNAFFRLFLPIGYNIYVYLHRVGERVRESYFVIDGSVHLLRRAVSNCVTWLSSLWYTFIFIESNPHTVYESHASTATTTTSESVFYFLDFFFWMLLFRFGRVKASQSSRINHLLNVMQRKWKKIKLTLRCESMRMQNGSIVIRGECQY